MANFKCPHCEALVQAHLLESQTQIVPSNPSTRVTMYDGAVRCTSCGRIVGGIVDGTDGNKFKLLDYWPRHIGGRAFPDVPSGIGETADEAHRCLSVGANRGAIALARTVVEATAKDNGITAGNLEKKIDALAEKGVIGQDTAQAAHAVRLWGNDAAHGDLAFEEFSPEDAQEVLALMDEVLNRAYQGPARVQRIIASREARKAGAQGGVPDV